MLAAAAGQAAAADGAAADPPSGLADEQLVVEIRMRPTSSPHVGGHRPMHVRANVDETARTARGHLR